jgi:transposase-like protein
MRERLIIDLLNRGVSVAEIAARLGVTEKRMRAIVREILARRRPEAPEDFVALQISRLNEALLVAYSAMSGQNLRAVDRVVKIVRELDRYHGFFAAERGAPRNPQDGEAKAEEPLALLAGRLKMAPQALEKTQFAPGNGMAADGLNEAVGQRPAEAAQDRSVLDEPPIGGPQKAPQAPEKAQSAPEKDRAPNTSDAAFAFLAGPAQAPGAPDAPQIARPQTAPQAPEKAQFAPENSVAPDSSAEPFLSPLAASAQDPLGHETLLTGQTEFSLRNGVGAQSPRPSESFRRLNVRATPNGVAAC